MIVTAESDIKFFLDFCIVIFNPKVTTIKPGEGVQPADGQKEEQKRNITTEDTLMDLVRNLFPENIIQAAVEKVQTVSIYPGKL